MATRSLKNDLTSREKEILDCLVKGLSSKQIADTLKISINTVTAHRKNMLIKTGAKSSAELVYLVISTHK